METRLIEVDIDDLKKYETNARRHTKEQIELIVASLAEYGYVSPIIVDEDLVVLAGHARLSALKERGEERVKVVQVIGLNEEEKAYFNLMDNYGYHGSYIDYEQVLKELEGIVKEKPQALGLSREEVASFFFYHGIEISDEEIKQTAKRLIEQRKEMEAKKEKNGKRRIKIYYNNKSDFIKIMRVLELTGLLQFVRKV